MNRKPKGSVLRHFHALWAKPRGEKLFLFILVVSFLIHVALLSITTQFGAIFSGMRLADFQVGEPAPHDVLVDKDITYVDEQATFMREEAVAGLVSPVFVINKEITERAMQDFTDFLASFTDARTKTASSDTIYLEIQADLPGFFTAQQIRDILDTGNVLPNLNESRLMLEEILDSGIAGANELERNALIDTVEIIRENKDTAQSEIVAVSSIVEHERLPGLAYESLLAGGIEGKNAQIIADIVSVFAAENAFFNEPLTERRRQEAVERVKPVVGRLVKGERIAQSGMIVTENDLKKITAFGQYSTSISLNMLFGTVFLIVFLYLLGYILLSPPVSSEALNRNDVYLILGIALIYSGLSVILTRATVVRYDLPVAVFLPSAFIAMLLAILINHRTAIVISLLLSLSLLPLTNMDPFPTLFAFFSSVAGAAVVIGAQKRLDLIRATIVLAVISGIVMAALSVLKNLDISQVLASLVWGFLNGFACGILNLGLLPFLEHLLNVATPFRLMELSDLNSPILKRMLTLAPGTYGHSVAVANLAESACRDIGARPLLARVGAYYHDIGKIDQAEYFVENQTDGNKHDVLKPSLSVAVIKSHVKIGVEKAKELGLPKDVVNIIAQHHGSVLISYFYVQALKNKGDNKVSPDDFSYTGIPPVSREAAVIMLADTVEAASRTIKNPNVTKLEKFVWKTVIEKFTSEQMSNCDLTFRDLEIIKRAFVHILAGHYHSRIDYPEADDKKSQAETS